MEPKFVDRSRRGMEIRANLLKAGHRRVALGLILLSIVGATLLAAPSATAAPVGHALNRGVLAAVAPNDDLSTSSTGIEYCGNDLPYCQWYALQFRHYGCDVDGPWWAWGVGYFFKWYC
jgi:hypothetical protein